MNDIFQIGSNFKKIEELRIVCSKNSIDINDLITGFMIEFINKEEWEMDKYRVNTLRVDAPKELIEEFSKVCSERGLIIKTVISEMINDFLKENVAEEAKYKENEKILYLKNILDLDAFEKEDDRFLINNVEKLEINF